MEKFEFKSAICTSREQSERLLALGLKKETADCGMYWSEMEGRWIYFMQNKAGILYSLCEDEIPAWSLHRLMEIMYNGDLFGFVNLTTHDRNIDTIYELVIANIEGLIKIDKFNKDYLEEKNC